MGMMLKLEFLTGRLVNWLGWPGFVQECDYRASAANVRVKVRKSPLYTVVTVNGMDVYFGRLTGRIDGIGLTPTSDYKAAETRLSGRLGETPAAAPREARS
jgi:hypothetical protein